MNYHATSTINNDQLGKLNQIHYRKFVFINCITIDRHASSYSFIHNFVKVFNSSFNCIHNHFTLQLHNHFRAKWTVNNTHINNYVVTTFTYTSYHLSINIFVIWSINLKRIKRKWDFKKNCWRTIRFSRFFGKGLKVTNQNKTSTLITSKPPGTKKCQIWLLRTLQS